MRFWGLDSMEKAADPIPLIPTRTSLYARAGARNGGNGTVARETSQPGRKTRWRIQGTAANDGHVRVEGWKHWTVSTKKKRGSR